MASIFWAPKPPPPRPDAASGSDASLVAEYRSGDASAFDVLYEKYVRTVFRFARGLTGRSEDAEDVTQETFIAALDGLRTVRQTDSVLPFLLGIAVRQWQSQRRRKARRERLAPTGPWEDAAEMTSGASVEQTVIIRDALQTLSDSDRAAFLLAAQAGLTHREAAVALGLPLGVVKWRISRATNHLRQLLGDDSSDGVSAALRRPFHSDAPEVISHVSQF